MWHAEQPAFLRKARARPARRARAPAGHPARIGRRAHPRLDRADVAGECFGEIRRRRFAPEDATKRGAVRPLASKAIHGLVERQVHLEGVLDGPQDLLLQRALRVGWGLMVPSTESPPRSGTDPGTNVVPERRPSIRRGLSDCARLAHVLLIDELERCLLAVAELRDVSVEGRAVGDDQ